MTRRAITQIVEAFFRRWPIYAALFLGCIGIGAVLVSNSTDEYTSQGSVFVDSQSLVANQSGVRETGSFSFLSPAQFTSQELNGLVRTEVFIEAALERAGAELDSDPILRRSQIDQLRASVSSSANSENLVAVVVTTPDPELSFRVASGVIEEFVRFKIDLDVTESGASERFFADLVESYEADLEAARTDVERALRGVTDVQQLTADRQLAVERLQEAEALAEERYTAALTNLEASRLATLQTETDVRQRYSVFDPPVIPVEPNGGLIDSLVVVLGFAILGLGLALAGPILSAALNRTVVFAEDVVSQAAGHPVLAILPRVAKREVRLGGIAVPEDGGTLSGSAVEIGGRTITFMPQDDGGPTSMADEANERMPVRPTPPGADANDVRSSSSTAPAQPTAEQSPTPAAREPEPGTAAPAPQPAPVVARPPGPPDAVPVEPVDTPRPPPIPAVAENEPMESAGLAIVDAAKTGEPTGTIDAATATTEISAGAEPAVNGTNAAEEAPDKPVVEVVTMDEILPDDVNGLLETTELGDHILPGPPSSWPGGPPPAPARPDAEARGEERRG